MNRSPRALLELLLPDAVAFLRRQVETNSFTANPQGVRRNAEIVAEGFRELGFAAAFCPAADPRYGPHLFLDRPGRGGSPVLLVTHLDTVFSTEEERRNAFRWTVEGDRIYGPGVIDNKGGTAMIWLVLSALRELDPGLYEDTHWIIGANALEEVLSEDFPARCAERIPPGCRAALVFEASVGREPGLALVQCRKGSANFRVLASGRGAHAGSRHHDGANAVVELAEVVGRIAALTDYPRGLTANVGSISGGGPSNRVPHEAECFVNIRAFEESVLQDAIDAMFRLEKEPPTVRAQSDGFPCAVRVEMLGRNPAWPPNPQTEALIALWIEAARQSGISLRAEPRGGLSDGNFLSRFLPVLDGLGPWGGNGHASERNADGSKLPEFVLVPSFLEMAEVNVRAIRDLLRS